MDWYYIFVGIIILIILIGIGAVSIPKEVTISTNQSSTTYNLSSTSLLKGITEYNLMGIFIIGFLAIILLIWALK